MSNSSSSGSRNSTVASKISNNVSLGDQISNSGGPHHNHSTEQPQTKRQKIEKTTAKDIGPPDIESSEQKQNSVVIETTASNGNGVDVEGNHHQLCSSLSSSATSITTPMSSSNNSPTSTPGSSRTTSLSQLLNVQNYNKATALSVSTVSIASSAITASASMAVTARKDTVDEDEVDRATTGSTIKHVMIASSSSVYQNKVIGSGTERSAHDDMSDMRAFETALMRQCLCGVDEQTLRRPFQIHYIDGSNTNGQRRLLKMSEWPQKKLLQFLSNLQLLFDVYLKQNTKGFICARLMDVCDGLVRNHHNDILQHFPTPYSRHHHHLQNRRHQNRSHHLIDELIALAGYEDTYVQFLAGRVLAAFLVVAKQDMNDDWLKRLVDTLFQHERLDRAAVQRIHFSLDVIRRIVEWKDIDSHPLEDEIVDQREHYHDNGRRRDEEAQLPSTSASNFGRFHEGNEVAQSVVGPTPSFLHFHTQNVTLETNYFQVHYQSPSTTTTIAGTNTMTHEPRNAPPTHSSALHSSSNERGCNIITRTDSESFDTTHLKCITIKTLENKWPGLVKTMSTLMTSTATNNNDNNNHQQQQQQRHHIRNVTEVCILNFLELWENIISVRANLSITETLPFYAQLERLELLLNQSRLPCNVYKQMLSLFNEALCYGSTLALQDMLPDETCRLAHQIVRHVKDSRILESLPRRRSENVVGLLGYKRQPVRYAKGTLYTMVELPETTTTTTSMVQRSNGSIATSSDNDMLEMDKTILQKMVLLVLKSIAVTVKEIRSDSSDSSIDSTDYDAIQDMLLIARSIYDVLQKLERFIKYTLDFHPDCHFSKILIHLFDDQDDHLIEAMVCTLDVTSGIAFRSNACPQLVTMLNPAYTFLEFLQMTGNNSDLLLDLLVSNETCFLLYLLRWLKYLRGNWLFFVRSCAELDQGGANRLSQMIAPVAVGGGTLDAAMTVLIRLRLQISRLVSQKLYPYDISPVLRLLESCESLYEGNELS